MKRPIIVINPNSNQSVTDGLRECLAQFNINKSHPIECVTLKIVKLLLEKTLIIDLASFK